MAFPTSLTVCSKQQPVVRGVVVPMTRDKAAAVGQDNVGVRIGKEFGLGPPAGNAKDSNPLPPDITLEIPAFRRVATHGCCRTPPDSARVWNGLVSSLRMPWECTGNAEPCCSPGMVSVGRAAAGAIASSWLPRSRRLCIAAGRGCKCGPALPRRDRGSHIDNAIALERPQAHGDDAGEGSSRE